MVKVLSVSVTDEQQAFLEENPELKPSKLLQQSIEALMMSCNKGDLANLVQHYKDLNKNIQNSHKQLIEFLNNKGLLDEFLSNKPKI